MTRVKQRVAGAAVVMIVALSGAIVADAHDVLAVRNVADVEVKVKGAYNRDLRRLVLRFRPDPC